MCMKYMNVKTYKALKDYSSYDVKTKEKYQSRSTNNLFL